MRNVKLVRQGGFGSAFTGSVIFFAIVGLLAGGCTQGSSGLFGEKWRTFNSPNQGTAPVASVTPTPAPARNGLADTHRSVPRRNEDPRAQQVARQVNEEVEQLRLVMAQQSQKSGDVYVSPGPTPGVSDSDSLAAKMAEPSPVPTASPAPVGESPKPVVTHSANVPLDDKQTQERPVITPIRKTPGGRGAVMESHSPVAKAPGTPSRGIRITRVEGVSVPQPTVTPTVAPVAPKPVAPVAKPKPAVKLETKSQVAANQKVEKAESRSPAPAKVEAVAAPATVTVADPAPANTGGKIDVPDPGNANAAMDMLLFRLEEKLKDRPEDTGTQMKLRLIHAVLGQWQQALKDRGGTDTVSAEMAKSVAALVKAFDNGEASSAQQANEALAIIEKMQQTLRSQADLVVSELQLCREVSSFGCFKTMPPEYFVEGKSLPVIIYLELENFTSKFVAEQKVYQTLLSMTIEVLSESGRSVWRQRYEKIEDIANRRRTDFYLAPQVTLPPAISAGSMKLKITVEDLHGNKVAQRSIPLEIRERR